MVAMKAQHNEVILAVPVKGMFANIGAHPELIKNGVWMASWFEPV